VNINLQIIQIKRW